MEDAAPRMIWLSSAVDGSRHPALQLPHLHEPDSQPLDVFGSVGLALLRCGWPYCWSSGGARSSSSYGAGARDEPGNFVGQEDVPVRERSEPSELLKQAVAQANGPIPSSAHRCCRSSRSVVEQAGGKITAEQKRREEHCFAIQYSSRTGESVSVNRRWDEEARVVY